MIISKPDLFWFSKPMNEFVENASNKLKTFVWKKCKDHQQNIVKCSRCWHLNTTLESYSWYCLHGIHEQFCVYELDQIHDITTRYDDKDDRLLHWCIKILIGKISFFITMYSISKTDKNIYTYILKLFTMKLRLVIFHNKIEATILYHKT